MKKILELLVCLFLHPIAVILIWIDLVKRDDINAFTKIVWAVLSLIPVVPIFYIFFSGKLW